MSTICYVNSSDDDVNLSDLYLDLSDLNLVLSDIMLTCQIYLLLSMCPQLGKNTFLRFFFHQMNM